MVDLRSERLNDCFPFFKIVDYRRMPEATIVNENYRCWPSYHHKGCLLSVFDVNEAMEVCENHSQCKAFVLTNQTTWTGNTCYQAEVTNDILTT